MGSCVVMEMKSRDEREITYSADTRIMCNKSFITSSEQVEFNGYSPQGESEQHASASQVFHQEQYYKDGVIQKESSDKCGGVAVKQMRIYDEDENNPKILMRQTCKEVILDEGSYNEKGLKGQGSIQNYHQISCQSTRNNTGSCSVISGNTQTSIPLGLTSLGMVTSQSSTSIPSGNPQVKINNSSFTSINCGSTLSSSNQNQNQNQNQNPNQSQSFQNTSICVNGIVQGRKSLLFRQKSQSPSKQRRNSSSRRTSMTTIDSSRSHMMSCNENISSNYHMQPSCFEDILMLEKSKNSDLATIQKICDDYIERKKIEYCNEYITDEFYNCIQDLAVALFKSQLQDLGKYYLDQLVHHKKVYTQKTLLKNLSQFQKKL